MQLHQNTTQPSVEVGREDFHQEIQRLKWELTLRDTERVQREQEQDVSRESLRKKVLALESELEQSRKQEKEVAENQQKEFISDTTRLQTLVSKLEQEKERQMASHREKLEELEERLSQWKREKISTEEEDRRKLK